MYLYVYISSVAVFQSNVIEAGIDMRRESEREWYYGNADKERLGPYSYEEVTNHSSFQNYFPKYGGSRRHWSSRSPGMDELKKNI